jgi:hypothetical protein
MTSNFSPFPPRASDTDLLLRMTKNQFKEAKELSFDWMLGGRKVLHRSQRRERRPFASSALSLTFLIGFLSGCATKEAATSVPKQQNGIQEYQQITANAIAAMNKALQSLNLVAAQSNPCPAKIVDAFADEVQQLQVDSLEIRSHAQAIQARGDAYFDNWSENLAHVKDPQVRELAERNHAQLQQSFAKIKATSQETGVAFRSFSAGLRKLRNSLQSNPAALESQSVQDLIRTTRANGEQVLQLLGSLQAELQTMKSMITPAKAASSN